jgi:hypothetical protein
VSALASFQRAHTHGLPTVVPAGAAYDTPGDALRSGCVSTPAFMGSVGCLGDDSDAERYGTWGREGHTAHASRACLNRHQTLKRLACIACDVGTAQSCRTLVGAYPATYTTRE